MKKVFEKIIEKQEELFQDLNVIEVLSHVDFDSTIQNSLENFLKAITNEAIEIVKQEAEQYQSSEIGFISKTEVLTLIEEIKCNDDIPKNYGTLLDIMRMIRNMPTVDNTDNGWIACSERLPKYGEVVMCSCTNSGITISCITHKGVKPSKSVRFGQHSVIAWQPLPHSYQPKRE